MFLQPLSCAMQNVWNIKPLAKAIVFSQFWIHLQLINSHLRLHSAELQVLKRDMKQPDKAAAVAAFQVGLVQFAVP